MALLCGASLGACKRERHAGEQRTRGTSVARTTAAIPNRTAAADGGAATTPHANLVVQTYATERTLYRWLSPVDANWRLTLTRPRQADAGTLAAVAGTYTSPGNEVEGLVMLDGRAVRDDAKPWEGLLVIIDGRISIRKLAKGKLSKAMLQELAGQRASLLQGHLLTHDRVAQPFRPSPKLTRRAIVTTSGVSAIVESQRPVELEQFAKDLVAAGVVNAVNLDMGGWSEGFYRLGDGSTQMIGEPGATERQSNWLVIETRVSPPPAN